VPLAGLAGLLLLAACDHTPAAEPVGDAAQFALAAPELLVCPNTESTRVTGRVGLLGGVLKGSGVEVVIPAGALSGLTDFELTVPASPYAEVEITANGHEHFQFLRPVVIALDYSRCGHVPLLLTVWHIDPATHTPLENMGGVNDVLGKRVIFSTNHLSGYAIAN
jgi:hypothetical protein